MSTSNSAKVIATCLIIGLSMQMCCSSAIPIWEFLTRNEKISYLYSTFAQLVSVHCKATAATSALPVNQCKRNLLSYGYEKLQIFSNEQLDALDPYQRKASELIWSSIMREHPNSVLITTRKPLPTPPATSIIILTHQNPMQQTPTNTNDESAEVASESSTQHYGKNPIFEGGKVGENANNKHEFAMDMDVAYGYPADKPQMKPSQVEIFDMKPAKVEQQTQDNEQKQEQANKEIQTFLTGPHVVRVRPDGTPVDEDQYQPFPRDDDLDAFNINTAVMLPPPPPSTPDPSSQIIHPASGRLTKHRKIAMISALKQKYMTNLALQRKRLQEATVQQPMQELQPPLERMHRQYPAITELLTYHA